MIHFIWGHAAQRIQTLIFSSFLLFAGDRLVNVSPIVTPALVMLPPPPIDEVVAFDIACRGNCQKWEIAAAAIDSYAQENRIMTELQRQLATFAVQQYAKCAPPSTRQHILFLSQAFLPETLHDLPAKLDGASNTQCFEVLRLLEQRYGASSGGAAGKAGGGGGAAGTAGVSARSPLGFGSRAALPMTRDRIVAIETSLSTNPDEELELLLCHNQALLSENTALKMQLQCSESRQQVELLENAYNRIVEQLYADIATIQRLNSEITGLSNANIDLQASLREAQLAIKRTDNVVVSRAARVGSESKSSEVALKEAEQRLTGVWQRQRLELVEELKQAQLGEIAAQKRYLEASQRLHMECSTLESMKQSNCELQKRIEDLHVRLSSCPAADAACEEPARPTVADRACQTDPSVQPHLPLCAEGDDAAVAIIRRLHDVNAELRQRLQQAMGVLRQYHRDDVLAPANVACGEEQSKSID